MSDFDEFDKLAAELETRTPQKMRKLAGQVVRKSILDIQRDGMAGTPVDTGNLRSSWSSEFTGSNANLAQGETGPTAEYAEYVHDGTSRQAPNPFAWRALDHNEPAFIAAVEAIGGEIL